ncbi:MAG: IclR family transcriptional regulator [Pseudomonadota bacterium]
MAVATNLPQSAEIRSLRALTILETVAREDRVLTIAELETLCGLPRATLYRLTEKLVNEGHLHRQIGGRGFTIGHRLFSMAKNVMEGNSVRLVRQQILRKLVERVGETCNLSVPDGDSMMYLERVEAHWPLRLSMPVGTRVPIHCTAVGKLYLALMDEDEQHLKINSLKLEKTGNNTHTNRDDLTKELVRIRKQNFSTDNEEFIPGMVAVSVPITDVRGRMIAGVAVTAPIARLSLANALRYLPDLREAANDLSNYLEHK